MNAGLRAPKIAVVNQSSQQLFFTRSAGSTPLTAFTAFRLRATRSAPLASLWLAG